MQEKDSQVKTVIFQHFPIYIKKAFLKDWWKSHFIKQNVYS